MADGDVLLQLDFFDSRKFRQFAKRLLGTNESIHEMVMLVGRCVWYRCIVSEESKHGLSWTSKSLVDVIHRVQGITSMEGQYYIISGRKGKLPTRCGHPDDG